MPLPSFVVVGRCFLLLATLLAGALAARGDPASPQIPEREFRAVDLGLKPDEHGVVTEALQKAIDAVAAAGGGRLLLPAGIYPIGPVQLRSKLDLHLEAGAVLKLLPRNAPFPESGGKFLNLLSGASLQDVRVSGPGTIDGNGEAWWRDYRSKAYTARRPQVIALERCTRVELADFTSLNPPNTHISLRLCLDVTIRGLVLEAPDESPNTDGLNLSGRRYLIEKCRISTGDDNLVLLTHKAEGWSEPVCQDFAIRNCAFGFGHGLSIGSYTSGGLRGVIVEGCTFENTTSGIRMKAARGRGGIVEQLAYRNIRMRNVRTPIFISSYYPKEPERPDLDSPMRHERTTPVWKDILIEDLQATGARDAIILWGLPETPLGVVTLRHVRVDAEQGARLFNAPEVTLEDVVVNAASGVPITRWSPPEKS